MSQGELPFGAARAQSGQSALTVSELTARIRGVVEPQFLSVWVKGEVSNYRPAASGHAYFSLKDEGAMLSAACFSWASRNRQSRTPFELKDGLEVLCRGKISIYPPRGSYQLTVEQIEPVRALVAQVRAHSRNPAVGIMVGGSAVARVPQCADRLDADGVALDGREAVALAGRLAAGEGEVS